MKKLTFDPKDRGIQKERTHLLEGKVIHAEDFTAKVADKESGETSEVPGVKLRLDSCPYPLNILKGTLTGATKAAELLDCKVKFSGDMREYKDKEYFTPREMEIIEKSQLAKFAASGASFSGQL